MGLECPVCDHEHDDEGTCFCGCTAEQEVEEYCELCGCPEHTGRECKCGCEG